jgi:hypothetical protein
MERDQRRAGGEELGRISAAAPARSCRRVTTHATPTTTFPLAWPCSR